MKEKNAFHVNGYLGLLIAIVGALAGCWLLIHGYQAGRLGIIITGGIILAIVIIFSTSLTIIQPNEAKVLT
ncbi:MAG: SPFH domain-containing protein, partial [Limosilactobacillus sp.]